MRKDLAEKVKKGPGAFVYLANDPNRQKEVAYVGGVKFPAGLAVAVGEKLAFKLRCLSSFEEVPSKTAAPAAPVVAATEKPKTSRSRTRKEPEKPKADTPDDDEFSETESGEE